MKKINHVPRIAHINIELEQMLIGHLRTAGLIVRSLPNIICSTSTTNPDPAFNPSQFISNEYVNSSYIIRGIIFKISFCDTIVSRGTLTMVAHACNSDKP